MNNKYNSIRRFIFPNKKINVFVICMFVLGLIAGAIFVNIISLNDKNLVLDKIKLFIDNINNGSLNSILLFKNSLFINIIYILIIFILGMSIIGLIFNLIILFIKGFIFGFSIASFILTYGYRGIILSFLYLLFGELINIFTIIGISICSIIFSIELLKLIFKNNYVFGKNRVRNYFLILLIAIVISVISSLSETFVLPALIKLLIKLFK